jgi:stage II sporulation protein P
LDVTAKGGGLPLSGLRWAGRKANRPFYYRISPIPILIIVFGTFIFLFSSFLGGIPETGGLKRQSTEAQEQNRVLVRLLSEVSVETLKGALRLGMTVFAIAETDNPERQAENFLLSSVKTIAQVDGFDPRSLLASQLAMLEVVPVAAAPVMAMYIEDEQGEDAERGRMVELPPEEEIEQIEPQPVVPLPSGTPLVAIYNTHNAETFVPTDGTYRLDGKNAGVVQVARTLADALTEKHGINVVRSERIHDYPKWSRSYANSEQTIKELLSAHPEIQILMDIHRDAGLRRKESVIINGKETAKVLLIVGSNKRLPHPAWRENLQFAQRLVAKMEDLYPGLSKGVRVQDGRYNQHMHRRAVLLEIGSTKNTLEEAKRAAELLAHVVAEVLRDMGVKPGN